MVFSDTGDLQGAFYDNNSGVDYHVPVSGSLASPPRLRITHISVEMAPIAKVVSSAMPLLCWLLELETFVVYSKSFHIYGMQGCEMQA